MRKKVKKLLCVVIVALLVVASMAMVACSKKKNETPSQPEDGEYYYTLNDAYTVTIDRGKATAFFVGFDSPKSGAYTRNGTSVTITLDGGTATGTLSGDELTLTYGGLEMHFLKKIMYTVTFDADGGSQVAAAQVINGKTVAEPTAPTRAGYTFVGWYADSAHTVPFTFDSEPIRKNTVVYGRFVATPPAQTEFTVTRMLGYEGAPALPPETTIGGRLYNTVADPKRDGYVFKGWWVSMYESEQKLSYEYGEDIVFKANTTLFALWQPAGETFATLSVRADGITWEKLSLSGTLTITAPDGDVITESIGASASRVYVYAFDTAQPGEYVVSLSSGGQTVTRYYLNKALDRVSRFTVLENNVLSFEPVANAQRYYLTVTCGNPDHEHTDMLLSGTTYSFINCPMRKGGIVFVVTAQADGLADSVSTPFVFSLDLQAVTGLSLDAQTGNLVWDAVENATSYLVCINGGDPITVPAPATSLDLREYSGELSVTIVPVAEGYNSPDPTEYTFERKELSAPSALTVTGSMLSWQKVDDATAYSVYINDSVFDTTDTRLDFTAIDFTFVTGEYYELSVQAKTETSASAPSVPLTARYGVMDTEITYSNGTVSWMPVIGVPGYMVRINDDSAIPVSAGKISQKIVLTSAGENKIAVRFTGADSGNSWVETTIVAYEVTFSALAGMSIDPVYKAAGDDFSDIQSPTYPGYIFAGWYNTRDGAEGNGTKYEESTVFKGDADLKLYAYWYAQTYNVALDYGESGEGDQTTAEITYQKDFTLPVPTVTDPTSVFLGWYATPDGSGLMYADAKGVCTMPWSMTDENATLYAYYASGCLEFMVNDNGYAVKAGAMVGAVHELEIPAIYKGSKVNAIAEYGFRNCKTLTKVSIPDTVKTIPATAFDGCTNIVAYAVRAEGEVDPYYSAAENALLYHNPITGYVELAFVPPTSADTYTVPEGVTRLGGRSLVAVHAENIVVPYTVTMVDENAFSSAGIKTVTFTAAPSGTAEKALEIKAGTFGDENTELTALHLPARLIKLGNAPHELFAGSKLLTAINISGTFADAVYSSNDGVLCSANGDTIVYCPTGKTGPYTVPSSAIYIEDNAFNGVGGEYGFSSQDYNGITEITFHANVQKIGKSAFEECINLTKAVFLASPNHPPLTIGERAFYGCTNLKTLTFTEEGTMQKTGTADAPVFTFNATRSCGVSEIGAYAFYGCEFSSVLLPSTLTAIGERAFEDNRALTAIDFSHVRTDLSIAAYAFADCSGLSSLNLTDNVGLIAFPAVFSGCTGIGGFTVGDNPHYETDDQGVLYNKGKTAIVFYPDNASTVYVLPSSITAIEDGAFLNKRLTSVTIHGGVTRIGVSAFEGCRSLATVELQESTAADATLQIQDKAFYNCAKLDSITLPARTTEIGAYSFAASNGTSLSAVTLNEGLTSIGAQAFYGSSALKNITIPASVTRIGAQAFGHSGITSVTFSVASRQNPSLDFGDGVFTGSAIVSITLPEGLTRIPDDTFRDCASLTSVTVPASVKNDGTTRGIGNRAFKNCRRLDTITFTPGTGALSFGNYVFDGCSDLTELYLPARIAAMSGEYDVFVMGGTTKQESYSAPNPNVYNAFYSEQSPRTLSCPIAAIHVAAGGAEFASSDGILYTADFGVLVFCPQGKSGVVEIAKETTTLRKTSFLDCSLITAVTFQTGGDKPFKLASAKDNDLYDSAYATTENVFVNCAQLTSIAFPARLTTIGSYALQQIKKFPNGITSITFADGCNLTGIGKAAFSGLDIVSMTLPANVGKVNGVGGVSADVFKDCNALDTVTISKNLDEASFDNIMASCPTIGHIIVPTDSVNFSEENGIIYNKSKTSLLYVSFGATADELIIPATITKIADKTFQNVKGIKAIVFASDGNAQSLQIGKEAFADSGVTNVTLPARLNNLGTAAFKGCTDLTDVLFETGFAYAAIPAETFAGSGVRNICIPSSVVAINEAAFSDCASLVSVTFQSASDSFNNDVYKLVRVDKGAFRNCTSLTSITLPDTVTRIGKEAFMGCSALASIGLPANLTLLGPKDDTTNVVDNNSFSNVFTDCVALSAVRLSAEMPYKPNGTRNASVALSPLASTSLPSGVTAIGWRTFANCTSLTALGLNNVVAVYDKAFENSGIKTIDLSGVQVFGEYAFSDCSALVSITLGRRNAPAADGITLGRGVFARCGSLTSVTLQDITIIGGSAFTATDLRTFDFTLVTSIGINAFADCIRLETAENIQTDLPSGVFSGCTSLQNVGMTDSVTSIGARAFFGCTALPSVALSQYVTGIGASAFEGCTALTQANVASTVTSIGERAFYGCVNADITVAPAADSRTIEKEAFRNSGIRSIDLTKTSFGYGTAVFMDAVRLESAVNINASTVYDNMFYGCTALKTATMTDNVTELRSHVFYNCTSLVNLTLSKKLQKISSIQRNAGWVFAGCTSLTQVTIPATVTTIGHYSFADCTSLTIVVCQGEPATISPNAFNGCTNLNMVSGKNIEIEDGLVYRDTTLISFGKNVVNAVVREGTTTLGTGAFQNCTTLESVVLPSSLTTLGDVRVFPVEISSVFDGCTNLREVTLPIGVTEITPYAFRNCTSLVKVNMPGVKFIQPYAFDGCTNLQTVLMPQAEILYDYAFRNCSGLDTIALPDTLTAIGYSLSSPYMCDGHVFEGCASLSSVQIPATVKKIPAYCFDGCVSLTSVTMTGVTSVGNYAFRNCKMLQEIDVKGVTSFGYGAFSGCESLTNEDISGASSVSSVYSYGVFGGCVNLQTLVTSSGTAIIRDNAVFDEANALLMYIGGEEEYTIPESTTAVGPGAFRYNVTLRRIVIPASVDKISSYAFEGTTALEEVVLPDTPIIIDSYAFDGSNLMSINTQYVTEIGNYAFRNCTRLEAIDTQNLTSIGNYAFADCTAVEEIRLTANMTRVGTNAFENWARPQKIYLAGISSYSGLSVWNSSWRKNCTAEIFINAI